MLLKKLSPFTMRILVPSQFNSQNIWSLPIRDLYKQTLKMMMERGLLLLKAVSLPSVELLTQFLKILN